MTTISACIPGFPFDFREVFLAIFIRFEPIRELQKVLPFKYVHFLLLFDYKYRYLSCELYKSLFFLALRKELIIFQFQYGAIKRTIRDSVSYTHLTLPTILRV